MRHNKLLIALLLIAVVQISFNCSVAPTAGTETGNPDIIACLSHSFNVFNTQKNLPSDFLPEGEKQLNPKRVYQQPQQVMIAKKLSASEDTVPTDGEGISLPDTLIIADTAFNIDTIIVERSGIDTLNDNSEWGTVEGTVTRESKYYDSLFIVDTVVTYDTVIVNVKSNNMEYVVDNWLFIEDDYSKSNIDSTYVIISSGMVPAPEVDDTVNADEYIPYRVQTSDLDYIIPEVRTDSFEVTVGRNYTAGDLVVAEAYYDNDGDGYLSISGSNQQCLAIVSYKKTETRYDVQVAFDAGADLKFETTADNRIESLYFAKTVGESIVESVYYGEKYFGIHGDTIKMVHNNLVVSEGVHVSRSEIACVKGEDPKDHRMNKFVAFKEKVNFTGEDAKDAEFHLVPDTPLNTGEVLLNALITIRINFGKGLTGIIEGKINYNQKTISGIYAVAGKEFSLEYTLGMEEPELFPIE